MRTITLLLLAAACQPAVTDEVAGAQLAITEGSPIAFGLLGFLNGPGAGVTVLDVDVGLDRRAAVNIVAHIDGADARRGTADDNPLDSIGELDAIAYVGAIALDKLQAYVEAHHLVPDLVVEEVPLTNAQAAAMVAAANQATLTQLDVDAGLDARAAANIVAARPLADIHALAAVKYVGKTALEHLRDYHFVPAGCMLTIEPSVNQSAADLTELLALATTRDYPAAEVVTFRVAGCSDALAHPAELVSALEKAIDWRYQPGTQLPLSDRGIVAGSAEYAGSLGSTRDAIQERIDEGSWDPAASARGAELWGNLSTLIASLQPAAGGDYREVHIDLNASECSQRAVVLIDARTLELRVVHRLPGC